MLSFVLVFPVGNSITVHAGHGDRYIAMQWWLGMLHIREQEASRRFELRIREIYIRDMNRGIIEWPIDREFSLVFSKKAGRHSNS